MKSAHFKSYITTILLLLFSVNISGQQEKTVLARVGSKVITTLDFDYRTAFTVRPQNLKPKEISLNNLIFEKILSIEAGKNNREVLENPFFLAKLKGIKEQLMRNSLYFEQAYNIVSADSNEIQNALKNSVREYEIEIYSITSDSLVSQLQDMEKHSPGLLPGIFTKLQEQSGEKLLQKVKYFDNNDGFVQSALYKTLLDTGAVAGPLKTAAGEYVIMKVINWTDYPVLPGRQLIERRNQVSDKIRSEKALAVWNNYQAEIMNGKRLEFKSAPFNTLADIAYENYERSKQQDSVSLNITETPAVNINIDLSTPFFTIDNKTWTVKDFRQEILSHPLVYRTKYLTRENFKYHFKMAIIDLLRDHYLTQEAYKKGIDKLEEVQSGTGIWSDAILSVSEQSRVLNSAVEKGIISKENKEEKKKYWDAYLADLRKKYSGSIIINYEEYNRIKLNNIDFMALQPGVPYPAVVPGFPVLTTSPDLNYGK